MWQTDRRWDGRTDRGTENTIHRAAWSQLKIYHIHHILTYRWVSALELHLSCTYPLIYFHIIDSTSHHIHQHQQTQTDSIPDSKVHGANMGPTWVLSAPDGPHASCYQGLSPCNKMHKVQQIHKPSNDGVEQKDTHASSWQARYMMYNMSNLEKSDNVNYRTRDHSVYVPRQWETALQCSTVIMSSLIGRAHTHNDPCRTAYSPTLSGNKKGVSGSDL